MTRAAQTAIWLLTAWGSVASAQAAGTDDVGLDLERPLRLDPPSIASDYASSNGRWELSVGPADVSVCPEPEVEDPRALIASSPAERTPAAPSFREATECDVRVVMAASLRKVRRKLLVDVAAYDADARLKGWEDLEEAMDSDERGRTMQLNDGQFQGDLTVGVGTSTVDANVGDVLSGESAPLDLNPLRDVSAQFDFLFRTSEAIQRWGFNTFIVRLRAAYKGAFNGVNSDPTDDEATESEFSISCGLSW